VISAAYSDRYRYPHNILGPMVADSAAKRVVKFFNHVGYYFLLDVDGRLEDASSTKAEVTRCSSGGVSGPGSPASSPWVAFLRNAGDRGNFAVLRIRPTHL
jgi:hypothetical protein